MSLKPLFLIFILLCIPLVNAYQPTQKDYEFLNILKDARERNISIDVHKLAKKLNVSLSHFDLDRLTVRESSSVTSTADATSSLPNRTIHTDVKIISTHSNSAVDLIVLRPDRSVSYSYFEFYLYSDYDNTPYKIEICSFENCTVLKGVINHFCALETYDTGGNLKRLKSITVTIGSDIYKFTNIRIMRKSLKTEKEIKEEEVPITKKALLLIKTRAFAGAFVGFLISMLLAYWVVKHKKETSIDVVA